MTKIDTADIAICHLVQTAKVWQPVLLTFLV